MRWLVKEGDWVERDQEIAELSADKVCFGLPSLRSERVAKLLLVEGQKIPPKTERFLLFEGEDEAASPP